MQEHNADVLIMGAGGAGLRAAIAAREAGADVLVVEKGIPGEAGCTVQSASDRTAFAHVDYNPRQHWLDMMLKGGLVARPELARRIAFEAPDRLADLERYGASLDTEDVGLEIVHALLAKARELGVRFAERTMMADLVVADAAPRRVVGCWGLDLSTQEMAVFSAPAVIVATGGPGELYSFNSFPDGMTGDGTAMAYRAGARLVNMEFVQIGPCTLHPMKLAVPSTFWRMNPRLLNSKGEEFLAERLPAGSDAAKALKAKGDSVTFSVGDESMYVDIAVFEEMTSGEAGPHGGVLLDLSHNPASEIESKAGASFERLLAGGVDLRKEPVEFAPSVQYFNGGVLIDERAASDVPGLYACGEAAGGQHGADWPGGNAIADSQVYGAIAGSEAAKYAAHYSSQPELIRTFAERQLRTLLAVPADPSESWSGPLGGIRSMMWRNVSVVRREGGLSGTASSLKMAAGQLARGRPADIRSYLELRNLLDIGQAVVAAARTRAESRGAHYRADYPRRNDGNWLKQIMLRYAEKTPEVQVTPVEVPDEVTKDPHTGKL